MERIWEIEENSQGLNYDWETKIIGGQHRIKQPVNLSTTVTRTKGTSKKTLRIVKLIIEIVDTIVVTSIKKCIKPKKFIRTTISVKRFNNLEGNLNRIKVKINIKIIVAYNIIEWKIKTRTRLKLLVFWW